MKIIILVQQVGTEEINGRYEREQGEKYTWKCLCKRLGINHVNKKYPYEPEAVIENKRKILWVIDKIQTK